MVPLQNYYYLSQYLEWFTIYITKSEVKSDEKGLSYSHDKICIQNLMKILFLDFKLFHFTNTHSLFSPDRTEYISHHGAPPLRKIKLFFL